MADDVNQFNQKDPHSVEMIFKLKINECLNSIIGVGILMLDSCFFVVVW